MTQRERRPPRGEPTATERAGTTPSANLVQPTSPEDAFMVPVNFSLSEGDGTTTRYVVSAIIDSGSPVSLIKSSPNEYSLRGLNGSRLAVYAVSNTRMKEEGVVCQIKLLVVPDNTMAYAMILSRDFML